MNREEILEGNKIIAKYMGVFVKDEELILYRTWDWLMPVVIKLINENYSNFHIGGDGYVRHGEMSVNLFDDSTIGYQGYGKVGEELDAVWKAVVETIKKL